MLRARLVTCRPGAGQRIIEMSIVVDSFLLEPAIEELESEDSLSSLEAGSTDLDPPAVTMHLATRSLCAAESLLRLV